MTDGRRGTLRGVRRGGGRVGANALARVGQRRCEEGASEQCIQYRCSFVSEF
jgi:hypothetical protein